MTVDLHIHSTASDGALTPREIVDLAASCDVTTIALTDHDSVDGVEQAIAAGAGAGITVIPGIELSAETPDGRDTHILGYFIDDRDPDLLGHLARLRETRIERAHKMVDALAHAGIPVRFEDVLAQARSGAVGRVHIALALVEAGAAPSVSAAFSQLIGRDGPYYIRKPVPSPEEVIATIRAARGIAVLAHPAVSGVLDLVPALAHAGLEGVEAYHSQQDSDTAQRIASAAVELGLIVTGGSDFHGLPGSHTSLGDGGTPDAVVADLFARAGDRAQRTGR